MSVACTSSSTFKSLEAFWNATGGEHWSYQQNVQRWDFTNPLSSTNDPCKDEWAGLICTSTCDIYHLELSNYNLTGSIPSSFAQLVNLSHVDLSYNSLQAISPNAMDGIFNLTYIDLSYNYIVGTLPSSLFEGPFWESVYLILGSGFLRGSLFGGPSRAGLERQSIWWTLSEPLPWGTLHTWEMPLRASEI